MPRFAANLTTMFNELPFLERFQAAARAGFEAVEFLFPYAYPAAEIADRLKAANLRNVLFNVPAGDWEAGERGIGALPGREDEYRAGLATALRYAQMLGTSSLHVMSGCVPGGAERAAYRARYLANLRLAAQEAAACGITVLVEAINSRDMPGYLVATQAEAHALRAEAGAANVKVQMDLYHAQITEGDVTTQLRGRIQDIGHVQIAGVPERHEPDRGELNHIHLFSLLDELGYEGWVGCEYLPAGGTLEGLGWFAPWRVR